MDVPYQLRLDHWLLLYLQRSIEMTLAFEGVKLDCARLENGRGISRKRWKLGRRTTTPPSNMHPTIVVPVLVAFGSGTPRACRAALRVWLEKSKPGMLLSSRALCQAERAISVVLAVGSCRWVRSGVLRISRRSNGVDGVELSSCDGGEALYV